MKISKLTDEKQMVSARISKFVFSEYKKSDIPISTVIETGLIHFLRLSDEERVKFLAENLPDNVEEDEINPFSLGWEELLVNSFKKLNIPEDTAKMLVTSSLGGALTIFAGLLEAFSRRKD